MPWTDLLKWGSNLERNKKYHNIKNGCAASVALYQGVKQEERKADH
jgi:hypothetical protein